MFEYADQDAAQHVDQQDHDAGDGVTAHKLGGTVHRAVEVRFVGHILTPHPRLFLINQPGIEIGVDRHLFARQRVEGKARRYFRNTLGPFGHHHKVDHGRRHRRRA